MTGVDDADEDGDIAYTIVTDPAVSADPDYAMRDPADVSVTNTDDDAPSGDVTVVSVTARDIRLGGKYNILATVSNTTAQAVEVLVECETDDGAGNGESLLPRLVAVGAGQTVDVKFNDYSDSGLPKGTYVATVTIPGHDEVGEQDTFRIR